VQKGYFCPSPRKVPEEKTRNGILSTLRTAAKLAQLGILTGIRSNKPVRSDHILLKDGFDHKATRSPLGCEHIISFRLAITTGKRRRRFGPESVPAALEPVHTV
jgi:hypothetical protein